MLIYKIMIVITVINAMSFIDEIPRLEGPIKEYIIESNPAFIHR